MDQIFRTYENKLIKSGLVGPEPPLLGFLDAHLEWNRTDRKRSDLEDIFKELNISALIFARPAEPYRSIIDYLANTSNGTITPNDCETRTFLHDLPVSFQFSSNSIVSSLKARSRLWYYHSWNRRPRTGLCYVFFCMFCWFCKIFLRFSSSGKERTCGFKRTTYV